MSTGPDRNADAIAAALWPLSRLGEGLAMLATAAGLPVEPLHFPATPSALEFDELTAWIEAAADALGIEAHPVVFSADELQTLIGGAPPMLLRVKLAGHDGFLAVTSGGTRRLSAIGPDFRRHRLSVAAVAGAVRQQVEEPILPALERVLDSMSISARRRARARVALLAEHAKLARFRSCWLLRLSPGGLLLDHAREIRLRGSLVLLASTYVAQYLLFVVSWWLLGRGVLNGTIDRGWLVGWTLLLISLIPFRLVATWSQGAIATTVGTWLRRRLLRGALLIEQETVRRQGAGQLFGVVMESAAIESLALSGGVAALFSAIELAFAAVVLWSGGRVLPGILLSLWGALAAWLTLRYLKNRRGWTRQRLGLTHELLDTMIGHRTKLAQQPVEQWHPGEDLALAHYVEQARSMDRSGVWLSAVVPRGWLTISLIALIPAVISQPPPAQVAIAIGGILLVYRALRRLSAGLSNLAGAAIAWESIRDLLAAASRKERAPDPSAVVAREALPTTQDSPTVQVRDLAFRYPGQVEPVLQGCNLVVTRGSRLLLEGISGAGKSTLVSLLAGVRIPTSGLLLVSGRDCSVLGKAGWRRRVVMAPQAHDNFLIGGSLAFNLLMGCRWPPLPADLVEAETVCRELGLGDLLDRLPGGLHQPVGETGWQLSQGERTRVFLARALLQKPDVLILDESFSALDPENVDRASRCVQRRAHTVIAVAHT